ncbi:MAG: hypothetical protein AVDCRST_MAG73-868, partial [uncultured Thermomicrobiales bacterium]
DPSTRRTTPDRQTGQARRARRQPAVVPLGDAAANGGRLCGVLDLPPRQRVVGQLHRLAGVPDRAGVRRSAPLPEPVPGRRVPGIGCQHVPIRADVPAVEHRRLAWPGVGDRGQRQAAERLPDHLLRAGGHLRDRHRPGLEVALPAHARPVQPTAEHRRPAVARVPPGSGAGPALDRALLAVEKPRLHDGAVHRRVERHRPHDVRGGNGRRRQQLARLLGDHLAAVAADDGLRRRDRNHRDAPGLRPGLHHEFGRRQLAARRAVQLDDGRRRLPVDRRLRSAQPGLRDGDGDRVVRDCAGGDAGAVAVPAQLDGVL